MPLTFVAVGIRLIVWMTSRAMRLFGLAPVTAEAVRFHVLALREGFKVPGVDAPVVLTAMMASMSLATRQRASDGFIENAIDVFVAEGRPAIGFAVSAKPAPAVTSIPFELGNFYPLFDGLRPSGAAARQAKGDGQVGQGDGHDLVLVR
jgi:hypothetical protein